MDSTSLWYKSTIVATPVYWGDFPAIGMKMNMSIYKVEWGILQEDPEIRCSDLQYDTSYRLGIEPASAFCDLLYLWLWPLSDSISTRWLSDQQHSTQYTEFTDLSKT